jgi:hypothetical protein
MTDISLEFIRDCGIAEGVARPAQLGTCAIDGCEQDCELEFRHTTDDAITWIPLCVDHEIDRYHGHPLEYVVELHGFLPRCRPIVAVET